MQDKAPATLTDNNPTVNIDWRVLDRFVGILGCRIDMKERERLVKFIRAEIKALEAQSPDPIDAKVVRLHGPRAGDEADAIRRQKIRAWQFLGHTTFDATVSRMKDKTSFLPAREA